MESESKINKKKLLSYILVNLGVLLIGLIVGIILNFTINSPTFLYSFLISYPFNIIVFLTVYYTFTHFSNDSKAKMSFLICYIIRFLSLILAMGLIYLYLYLNNMGTSLNVLYLGIPCVIFMISTISVAIIK